MSTVSPSEPNCEDGRSLLASSLHPVVQRLQRLDTLISDIRYKSGSTCHPFSNDQPQLQDLVPRIAVIGSQSSGKTSLLEALAGLPYGTLPTGHGIVTRLPLHIHIHHANSELESPRTATSWSDEDILKPGASWISFSHLGDKKVDISKAKDEIEKRSDEILSKEFPENDPKICISATPIEIHLYSTNPVAEISFIDLPGLTRVALTGQCADMSLRLRELSLKYCSPANTIILAITPLNTDLANSESLTLAKACDPEGARTVGVLTKADLVEDGVDVSKLLDGSLLPLPLGYFAVVASGTSRGYGGIDAEREFFRNAVPYSTISLSLRSRCGVEVMSSNLMWLLCQAASIQLPLLSQAVDSELLKTETSLRRKKNPSQFILGAQSSSSKHSPMSFLLWAVTSFSRNFHDLIEGRLSADATELNGGAKIQQIFMDLFKKSLDNLNPLQGLSHQDIALAIKNSSGVKQSLFIPDLAFETLVRRQLRLFERPCLKCVDLVYSELKLLLKVTEGLYKDHLEPFENLRKEIFNVCEGVLDQSLPNAQRMVSQLLEIEHSYIHTSNPSFHASLPMNTTPPSVDDNQPAHQIRHMSMVHQHPVIKVLNHRMDENILWVQRLLQRYLNIVRTNLVDSVPKAVMHFLVHEVKEKIGTQLIEELYDDDKMDYLLKIVEDNEIDVERLGDHLNKLEVVRIQIEDCLQAMSNCLR
eukprot:GHVH01001251.1.p1 GENE.GHVH01001251.1~~GHVH01001251.1.p1  ORF type:complete len:703 (-),score=79.02 GHVH01001251.1:1187-3295(-)